jgi:Ca2+-transporting ATPase
MRLLGLAFKELPPGATPSYDRLVWVGLVALVDPIREGVREAIGACHRAGIRTVMMTGDQTLTALAVARELGLVEHGQMRVIDASDLGRLEARDLRGLSHEVTVFARVSPAHKFQIVRALQAEGEVVAMTGDGINDGPALKAADIGVAMGARGTDLARDLADVVLLDDDFGAVVGAIEQGRTIFGNIRKALRFLLATNFSEILLTVGALALGLGRPLSPAQFLWINVLSDVFPALALAVEPPDPEVMARPPRRPGEPIVSRRSLAATTADAAVIAGAALGAYHLALARGAAAGRAATVAFTTLTSGQLLYALTCRSGARPGLAGLGKNPLLVGAVGGGLALQAAATTVPFLRRLLGTTPLTAADWSVVAGGAALPLAISELSKAFAAPERRR